jgi:phage terminase large subunit-like protein
MGVANFTPPKAMPKAEAKGLRRKLLKQRQRARVPKLDTKTRRLAAAALAFKSGAVVIPAGEAEVMARLLTAFLQNPPAIADEITRRYPQDLAIQILAELERKANL